MPNTERMMFTSTNQAEGAIPNGARIRKVNSEAEDGHKDGDLGTVIGSLPTDLAPLEVRTSMPQPHAESEFAYFIEWDDMPGIHVGTLSSKVEQVDG